MHRRLLRRAYVISRVNLLLIGQRSYSSSLLAEYNRLVEHGSVVRDEHQENTLQLLDKLSQDLVAWEKIRKLPESATAIVEEKVEEPSSIWSWIGFGSKPESKSSEILVAQTSPGLPKSIYMWGGTGCGKTFMMNLFYDHVNIPENLKKKVHFNSFMIEVHKKLFKLKENTSGSQTCVENHIMDSVAKELMDDAVLLCFDEFQVTDVADAMILKALIESMFRAGIVIVATSNRPPDDLYKNGLQRALFIPCIEMLKAKSEVISLAASDTDYRTLKAENSDKTTYLCPITKANTMQFERQFANFAQISTADSSLPNKISKPWWHPMTLRVYGHNLVIPRVVIGRRIAYFAFKDICEATLGAADYIDLAERFSVIFLANVPLLNLSIHRNEMRRMITLIDALYEARVRVVFLAAETPLKLLQVTEAEKAASATDEVFAFDRTVSRLLEMQSTEYWELCSTLRPVGSNFLAEMHIRVNSLKLREVELNSHSMQQTANANKKLEAPIMTTQGVEVMAQATSKLSPKLTMSLWSHYNVLSDTSTTITVAVFEVLLQDIQQLYASRLEGATGSETSLLPAFQAKLVPYRESGLDYKQFCMLLEYIDMYLTK